MEGFKSGIVTRQNVDVYGVLATNWTALYCASGAYTILYLVIYQKIRNFIFRYFKTSKNTACLSAVQSVLDAEEKRFKEIFLT